MSCEESVLAEGVGFVRSVFAGVFGGIGNLVPPFSPPFHRSVANYRRWPFRNGGRPRDCRQSGPLLRVSISAAAVRAPDKSASLRSSAASGEHLSQPQPVDVRYPPKQGTTSVLGNMSCAELKYVRNTNDFGDRL